MTQFVFFTIKLEGGGTKGSVDAVVGDVAALAPFLPFTFFTFDFFTAASTIATATGTMTGRAGDGTLGATTSSTPGTS